MSGPSASKPEEVDVAIVGGGVAGAATACAFGRTSCRVALFERRPLRKDANRGDALHATVAELLAGWGALDELESRGAFWVRRMQLTTRRDMPRVSFALDRAPLLVMAHAEIELGLCEAARRSGVAIEEGRVKSVRREGSRWRLAVGDRVISTRLLVGADGASSAVREAAGIDVESRDYGQVTLVLHARRPDWLAPDLMWVLMHPDGGVLALPTTPAGRCRVVVQFRESEAASWRGLTEAQLRTRLSRRHRDLGDLELLDDAGSHVYRLSRQNARRYVDAGCALVGDAAHVTHPNGGQGMAMAVHDAHELARLAAPALAGRDDDTGGLTHALWEYAARRRPACTAVIARADRVARLQSGARAGHAATVGLLGALSLAPSLASRQFQRFGGS